MPNYPHTPDGRYFLVRGRLWRLSDPRLAPDERACLVGELMHARRAVREAKGNPAALKEARERVDAAKRALGERGPVWWDDGTPDYNRRMAKNTPYRDWGKGFETMDVTKRKIPAKRGANTLQY